MEIKKRVSRIIICALFLIVALWSYASHAMTKTLAYSFSHDASPVIAERKLDVLTSYAKSLIAHIAKDAGYNLQTSAGHDGELSVILNIVKTEENTEEYFWLTPVFSFDCLKFTLPCTPNFDDEASLGVAYIALEKNAAASAIEQHLVELISDYKVSSAFYQLANQTISLVRPQMPDATLQYGVLSLHGDMVSDASNLWVIADVVPLFSQLDERGRLTGIAVELVKGLLNDMGMSAAILSAPWKRIAKEAMTKSNVLVFSIVKTQERDAVFHWVTPVSRNYHGLYGINTPVFASLDALPQTYTVGTIQEDYRNEIAIKYNLKIRSFETWDELVEALYKGDVDLAFGSKAGLDFGCKLASLNCNGITESVTSGVSTAYLALSKKQTSILVFERLKLAAAKVRKSESYRSKLAAWSKMVARDYSIAHHTNNGVVHLWKKE